MNAGAMFGMAASFGLKNASITSTGFIADGVWPADSHTINGTTCGEIRLANNFANAYRYCWNTEVTPALTSMTAAAQKLDTGNFMQA